MQVIKVILTIKFLKQQLIPEDIIQLQWTIETTAK